MIGNHNNVHEVVLNEGTFNFENGTIMMDDTIQDYNPHYGVENSGTFTMSGGNIVGNPDNWDKFFFHGVKNKQKGTFTMSGGTISGCNSQQCEGGGGVYNEGTFTMSGGTISGCNMECINGGGGGVFQNQSSDKHTSMYVSGNATIIDNYKNKALNVDGANVYGDNTTYPIFYMAGDFTGEIQMYGGSVKSFPFVQFYEPKLYKGIDKFSVVISSEEEGKKNMHLKIESNDGPIYLYSDYSSDDTCRTVTFDLDGHGENVSMKLEAESTKNGIVHPSIVPLPDELVSPTAEGYIFEGWYKDKNYTEKWHFFGDDNPDSIGNSNPTIYSKWTKKADPDPKPDPEPDPDPDPKPTRQFKDVNYSTWMGEAINYVNKKGYMVGVSSDYFKPDDTCTREMMVQILYNIDGKPSVKAENPFKDNKKGKWYYNSILWAAKNSMTTGVAPSTFGIGNDVTRQEMAGFLFNYSKFKGYSTEETKDLNEFPDANEISGWAVNMMKWANANGIINGKVENGVKILDPKGKATRAEVAQMIMNLQSKKN